MVDIDQRERQKNVFRDLTSERDQLWAEAVTYWRLGEPLYLAPELEQVARNVQEDHRARHPWEGLIADYLAQEVPADWHRWDNRQREIYRNGGMKYEGALAPRSHICAAEIWCEVLGKHRGDMRQRDTREINSLLERAEGRTGVGVRDAGKPYGKQRCFERKAATDTPATD